MSDLPPLSDSRVTWLAGATGLVGTCLIPRLLASPRVAVVHALVRRLPDVPRTDTRLQYHPVDFTHLPALPAADDVVIALGTTIAVAGSREAFRRVDFDAVLAVATAAREAGATRLALVSAMGADVQSGVFYSRVKGEVEQAVTALGFRQVVIAQPALLLGDRTALGQPERRGEGLMARLTVPLSPWLPRAIRPIEADRVAEALVTALDSDLPGVHRLSSAGMQPRHHRART